MFTIHGIGPHLASGLVNFLAPQAGVVREVFSKPPPRVFAAKERKERKGKALPEFWGTIFPLRSEILNHEGHEFHE